jgi:hypothetical protein
MNHMAARKHCSYHGKVYSRWYCESCDRSFCAQCKPFPRHQRRRVGSDTCLLCEAPLLALGRSSEAPPLLQSFLSALAYPLQRYALSRTVPLTAVISILALLLLSLPSGAIAMILIAPLALSAFLHWLSKLLCGESRGLKNQRHEQRQIADFSFLFAHISLLGFWLTLGWSLSLVLGVLAPVAWLLVAAAAPASIVILARDESLAGALSPPTLLHIMRIPGNRYLHYWLFCVSLLLTTAFVVNGLATVFSLTGPAIVLIVFIPIYSVTAFYSFSGRFLFAEQVYLEHVVPTLQEAASNEQDYEIARVIGECTVLSREKQFDRAEALFMPVWERYPKDLALNECRLDFLKRSNNMERYKNQAAYLLDQYILKDDPNNAARLYSEAASANITLEIEEAKTAIELASTLAEKGRWKLGLSLLKQRLEKPYEASMKEPLYKATARIVANFKNDPEQASRILQQLQDNP